MARIDITDNIYLILFFSAFFILSIVFLLLGLNNVMEYNLAIGLFTSFLTTSLTVIFLNFVLSFRRQKQWKEVRDNAFFEISVEIATIFSVIIDLVEGPFAALSFKMTLNNTKDVSIKKTLIFSKIKEYHDSKQQLKLAVNKLDSFTNETFKEVRTNLYSIHVIYGNLIDNAKIVNDIIIIRNMLRAFELMQEGVTAFDKMVGENQPLMSQAQKMFPELKQLNINNLTNSLTELALPLQTQKLVEIIYDLWKLEIQFDQA
jgi:hypothetical protein